VRIQYVLEVKPLEMPGKGILVFFLHTKHKATDRTNVLATYLEVLGSTARVPTPSEVLAGIVSL